MRTRPTVLYHAPAGHAVPDLVRRWAEARELPLLALSDPAEVQAIILRGFPCFLFVEADGTGAAGLALVRTLKSDAFTAIVPVVLLSGRHDPAQVESWFAAGTDEVVTSLFSPAEQRARIDAILTRTERDVSVHPSTRLPGTTEIEREIRRQLDGGGEFAVCYADLDHFKEFNDRYSYYDGDRVIYILSRILHDVAKGLLGERGFVGHIGGDDFIFVIPLNEVSGVCTEIISVFDTLVPLQYNDQDRRAGYFFGKDRRGQLHRVPLMTLSIGIVTNRSRKFTHPAQVSELATEMKSYAKTLPGSVFVVDRRQQSETEEPGERGPGAAR
ncbi:MAG TPA: diguanylate cyclase [Gemmatimonadales bacterium]|nr:diguanylate cyclase [Gemmatimonadales bacterium]